MACQPHESEAWHTFLHALTVDHSSIPGHAVLKYAEDRFVIRAEHPLGQGQLACRCVGERGLWVHFYRVGLSPGRRDFDRLAELSRSGIATTTPLAYLERAAKQPESWLITEFLSDAADLARIVLVDLPRMSDPVRTDTKRKLSRAVARWLATSVNAGWRHRDFKASNVLIAEVDSASPQALVVDLEGLHRRRPWHGSAGHFEVLRLTASLLNTPGLTLRDAARLLRDLKDHPGVCVPESTRSLLTEAESYLRRARRRKTHKLDGFSGA